MSCDYTIRIYVVSGKSLSEVREYMVDVLDEERSGLPRDTEMNLINVLNLSTGIATKLAGYNLPEWARTRKSIEEYFTQRVERAREAVKEIPDLLKKAEHSLNNYGPWRYIAEIASNMEKCVHTKSLPFDLTRDSFSMYDARDNGLIVYDSQARDGEDLFVLVYECCIPDEY